MQLRYPKVNVLGSLYQENHVLPICLLCHFLSFLSVFHFFFRFVICLLMSLVSQVSPRQVSLVVLGRVSFVETAQMNKRHFHMNQTCETELPDPHAHYKNVGAI